MAVKATCAIQNCGRQFVSRVDSPYCPLCRRNIAGWVGRPAAEIIERQADLQRWSQRMSEVRPRTTAKNVVAFRKAFGRRAS